MKVVFSCISFHVLITSKAVQSSFKANLDAPIMFKLLMAIITT